MNMKINCEADEKFRPFQEEICSFLFEMLQEINILEKEIFERNNELEAQKIKAGIPKNQIPQGWKELLVEFRERYFKIIDGKCTEKLLKRGYAGAFGSPQKFGYINEECRVNFIMKSEKKAVIETHYSHGVDSKQKFVLKKIDGKWMLDEFYYGFENEDHWYVDNI